MPQPCLLLEGGLRLSDHASFTPAEYATPYFLVYFDVKNVPENSEEMRITIMTVRLYVCLRMYERAYMFMYVYVHVCVFVCVSPWCDVRVSDPQ